MFLCPALYSTSPSRGLIKLCIFCKGWRHRCDISANKPLFPPPLSLCQITNCTAASLENGKEVRAKMDSSMERSARRLSLLSHFNKRETPGWSYCPLAVIHSTRVLPEVREVSLDVQVENGGRSGGAQRRTVLAQQVLELLTDLPDRQKVGGRERGFTICLQHNIAIYVFLKRFFFLLIILDQPTHEFSSTSRSKMKFKDKLKTKTTLPQHAAKIFCKCKVRVGCQRLSRMSFGMRVS